MEKREEKRVEKAKREIDGGDFDKREYGWLRRRKRQCEEGGIDVDYEEGEVEKRTKK